MNGVIASVLGLVCAWIILSLAFSVITGWASLARLYRCPENLGKPKMMTTTGWFRGGLQYSGVLMIGCNSYGLFLAISPIFSLFHPTLFIPLSELIIGPVEGRLLKSVSLGFTRLPSVHLEIAVKAYEKLKFGVNF